MMSSGLITDIAAIPVPDLAVPYAAPRAEINKNIKILLISHNTCAYFTLNHTLFLNILLISLPIKWQSYPHNVFITS